MLTNSLTEVYYKKVLDTGKSMHICSGESYYKRDLRWMSKTRLIKTYKVNEKHSEYI